MDKLSNPLRLLKGLFKNNSPPVTQPLHSADERLLRRFITDKLDPLAYLDVYPDVARAGLDPFDHWMDFGLKEGRHFPGMQFKRGVEAEETIDANWKVFHLKDEIVAVRLEKVTAEIPPLILDQIRHQARHDGAIFACGSNAFAKLRQFDANDLIDGCGLDVDKLLGSIETPPHSIIMIPRLIAGGAEKYAADLADALQFLCANPVVVIVTEQSEIEATGWRELNILNPFHNTQIIYWKDMCNDGNEQLPDALARYLNLLRPKVILVVNSMIGLDVVALYGRGLSQFAKIACAFFSLGLQGRYPTYGAIYARRVLPFATLLTDNKPMANSLNELYGPILSHGINLIQPCLHPGDEQQFSTRILTRRQRIGKPSPEEHWAKNWLWISRVEPLKGTDILAALADGRKADCFHIFGTLQNDAESIGLKASNIQIHDRVSDVPAADFTSYDGFVFTSLFEGMPNIVLEMSQHAIPMVLADVGGLRDTFNEDAVVFVKHLDSTKDTASAFSHALDHVSALSAEKMVAMAVAARAQALAGHSLDQHRQRVATVFLPGDP